MLYKTYFTIIRQLVTILKINMRNKCTKMSFLAHCVLLEAKDIIMGRFHQHLFAQTG